MAGWWWFLGNSRVACDPSAALSFTKVSAAIRSIKGWDAMLLSDPELLVFKQTRYQRRLLMTSCFVVGMNDMQGFHLEVRGPIICWVVFLARMGTLTSSKRRTSTEMFPPRLCPRGPCITGTFHAETARNSLGPMSIMDVVAKLGILSVLCTSSPR